MLKRVAYRLFTVLFIVSLVFLFKGMRHDSVKAQVLVPRAYLPIVLKPMFLYVPFLSKVYVRFEDFNGADPAWPFILSDPKDGTFVHRIDRLVAIIEDNSANSITWPGWRPPGDFKLEVDARFSDGRWLNGLGLVFGGSDDWTEYYVFILAFNFSQHHWALARVAPIERFYYLERYRGAPSWVHSYDRWNHLMVIRVGSSIRVYCNGRQMTDTTYTDAHYGANRLVGLTVTSFEWSEGEIQFDNFRLEGINVR